MSSTPTFTRADGQDLVAFRTDGLIAWTTVPDNNTSVSRLDSAPPSPPSSALALAPRPAGGHYVYVRGNDNKLTVRASTDG